MAAFERGDIVRVRLDPVEGHEMRGDSRPALVLTTPVQIARWISELSPRTKVWVMIGGDALFLPLCMIASVAFRLSSIEAALERICRARDHIRIISMRRADRHEQAIYRENFF